MRRERANPQRETGHHAFVIEAEEAEQLPHFGNVRASASDTGGAFEVIEYIGPSTPPPHVHRVHDEAFYVLQGRFEFVLGQETVSAGQGAFVLVPRGTRHGFTVAPGSRALVFTTPAGLVGFLREVGSGLSEGKSNAEIRAKLAGKYDSFPE
jgi:mannose-6-phosphate isomerase-like protein (cupin superfamily)